MEVDESEEDVFTILSHPVRRRILKTAFDNSSISIREMKTWGHSIGSIYHHLKIIDGYMTQNDSRQYILTDEGHDLCRWFLRSDEGAVKVQEIESFGSTPNQVIDFIKRYTYHTLPILLLLTILGITLSQSSSILIVGPMFYDKQGNMLVNNLILLFIHLGIYGSLQFLLTVNFKALIRTVYPHTVTGFLLASLPVYLEVIIITLVAQPVPYFLWMILTVINQIIFLVGITSLSIYVFNTDLKTSMLIALGTMYVIQMINLFVL